MSSPGTALLETREVSVTYGGVKAVDSVSIEVAQGQLVGLIGPNGAGKTSLIDVLSGFTLASAGTVTFDGSDVTKTRAHRRARAGLSRTFQSIELFNDLTVAENVQVAADGLNWRSVIRGIVLPQRHDSEAAMNVLDRVGLAHLADRLPPELSQGQRKLAGVARAMAGKPKFLLLDEPAAGLDTPESQELGVRLRAMVDLGATMLLVDHDMGLVLNVCDYIYVLEFGKVIAAGSPAEIRQNPAVIAAYLGESGAHGRDDDAGLPSRTTEAPVVSADSVEVNR